MRRARERGRDHVADQIWRRALWWTYAIAGSLYVLSRVDPTPGESATANVSIGLVVVGSSAPLVWLATRLGSGQPLRGRLPWPAVYAMSLLATALGATASWLVGLAFGRSGQVSASLVLEVFVVGPIWIVLIGSGVVLWQSARTRRQHLQDSLDEIEVLVEAGADVTQALEVVTRRELRHALAEVSAHGRKSSTTMSIEDWQRISGQLREMSRDIVRPLSHSLPRASRTSASWQRGPIGWIRRIVTREDFNPILVAAVFTAGAVSVRVQDYGWFSGLALLAAENALIFAVMMSANTLMRRVRYRAPVFIGAVALLQIIPLLPWPQVLGETPTPTIGERIASVIASVILILVASGVKAITSQSQARIEHLQALVDEASSAGSREATEIARITRELASRLHGSVQASLVATALAIETAAGEGRWEDATRSLDSLTGVLHDSTSGAPDEASTLATRIDRVCLPWRAVGEVHRELEAAVADLSGAAVEPVIRVIEEAVTNAFRHGQANRVDINVSAGDEGIAISIVDDGHGVGDMQRDRWGLGLTSIDEATSGGWSLDSQSGVTRFLAVLPEADVGDRASR